jgi:hypothetical protein
MWVPAVRRGRVVTRRDGSLLFDEISCLPDPGPVAKMTIKRKTFGLEPTGLRASPTISPDAESLATYTPAPTTWQDLPGSIGPDGRAYPRLFLSWPWPWSEMLLILDAFDPRNAQDRMRSLLKEARGDRAAAIAEARARAEPLVSSATSTLGLAKFWPTYSAVSLAVRDRPVPAFWEDWISARTFDEAQRDPRLSDPVPVTRIWGGLGLLWVLCLETLESGAPRWCPGCGWLLAGTRRQRRCGSSDNPACYRKQRATARRRQRRRTRDAQASLDS